MHSALARLSEPVYGTSSSSSSSCNDPSSPLRPWATMNTNAGRSARTRSRTMWSISSSTTSSPACRSAAATRRAPRRLTSRSIEVPPGGDRDPRSGHDDFGPLPRIASRLVSNVRVVWCFSACSAIAMSISSSSRSGKLSPAGSHR